jgi:hypothetical protein
MKNQIFLLVLIFLIFSFSSADAQKSKHFKKSRPKIGFGVKAGINDAVQSTSNDATDVTVESIVGFNGGVYCNYYIWDFLAVQPELMVSGKGAHWQDSYYNAKDILTYIDLPVFIKYQPVSLLNIHAGPQFGYRLAAKQKDLDTGLKTDIKDYYKDFDIGLAFGIEANFPFRVNLTIRYVLGLVPATVDTEYNEPWKNNFIQVSVGFRILER